MCIRDRSRGGLEGGSTRTRGVRKHSGGELNSPVVAWLSRGLTDDSQLWHFFGVRNDLGGRIEFSGGSVAK
eukprot:1336913-Pyramimonas_sp.AAC.1